MSNVVSGNFDETPQWVRDSAAQSIRLRWPWFNPDVADHVVPLKEHDE